MKLITKVAIKRFVRLHPLWTLGQVYEHIREYSDPAGPFGDNVTLEDVNDVIYSMRPPGRLL